MDDSRIVSFAGHLNPTAQEFRPRFHQHPHTQPPQLTLFSPPQPPSLLTEPLSAAQRPQFYYPYTGGVSYRNYSSPSHIPAYFSYTLHLQQQPFNLAQTPPSPPPLVTASRSLSISSVPKLVSEATVRNELGVFGEIRAVQMERVLNEGILTVHFYDLRDAQIALKEIRERHMEEQSRLRKHYNETQILAANYNLPPNCFDVVVGCKPVAAAARGLICGEAVWAKFIILMNCGGVISDGNNQGTIVIFNLDSSISASHLKQIFDAFGPVRELRETPLKRHQKFVEFYDIRDAAKALHEMNGKEINGNNIVIEFSRPGGQSKRFFNSNSTPHPLPPYETTEASSSYCTSQSSKKTKGKLENAMASLCISDTGSMEGGIQNGGPRKGSKKSNTNGNDNVKNQYKQSSKGKFKKYDSQFSINEDAITESNHRDSRTTVMIKNIPNKYCQKLILNMLDNHCIHCNEQISDSDDQVASAYDFLYLPIDFNNKCNVGYGFVNMTSPEATWRLYKAFHQQSWKVFNSRKICQVSYARVQGLKALKEHFKNSKFPNVTEEIFPVVFSPPRDGKYLSQPISIFGEPIFNLLSMDASDWTTQKEGKSNEGDDMGVTVE